MVALALQLDKTYVDGQLALKVNQSTTSTKTSVDTELATDAITFDMILALTCKASQSTTYTITPVEYFLTHMQLTITPSTKLTLASLTAQTHVITPALRTTNIEFSDVANYGATALSIKVAASTIMTMSPTAGISRITYTDFDTSYVYNISGIIGITLF